MPFIEDDDTFIQKEGLDVEEEEEHGHLFIYLMIIWVVWSALLSIFFLPRVIGAVEESGVEELIHEAAAESAASAYREVSVPYLLGAEFVFYQFESGRRGGDKYHDTIEALLEERCEEALQDGAISLIPRGTTLIGLTTKDGICYVDLSAGILSGSTVNGKSAADEIRTALLGFDEIEKVVIMAEGVVQNL